MIPRAINLVKARTPAFTNTRELLASQTNRPVIFTTKSCFQKQSLVCDANNLRFLFDHGYDAGCEVEEVFHSEFLDIHLLAQVPAERRILPYAQIAQHHVENPLALSYLGHLGLYLDALHTVRFCTRCGHARSLSSPQCSHCHLSHYAKVSPCAMVLVYNEYDEILMVKKFASSHWSLVAGFCEPMESMEQCAAREVFEETQVRVNQVDLILSQPWPFPHSQFEGTSLMFGCFAGVKKSSCNLPVADGKELSEAKWVPASEISSLPLPSRASLSRMLLDAVVEAQK